MNYHKDISNADINRNLLKSQVKVLLSKCGNDLNEREMYMDYYYSAR